MSDVFTCRECRENTSEEVGYTCQGCGEDFCRGCIDMGEGIDDILRCFDCLEKLFLEGVEKRLEKRRHLSRKNA